MPSGPSAGPIHREPAPADFDPKYLKRPTKIDNVEDRPEKQDSVRMMLPMSVRCKQCGNFLYRGTKFNMRKETCNDIDYLGIKVFRFYFKCTCCHGEITMRTDPKTHDYCVEHGATRNYDPMKKLIHD